MGPISTGLGEVYWWAVEYTQSGEGVPIRDGRPGWQSDGSYLTSEGGRLADEFQRIVYLRTVQDWIVRPQMKTVPGVAGADAIGGYVKQYHVQVISSFLHWHPALETLDDKSHQAARIHRPARRRVGGACAVAARRARPEAGDAGGRWIGLAGRSPICCRS